MNDSFCRSSLRLVDKTVVGSQNPLFWSSILSLLGNLVGVLAISSGYLPLPTLERTLNSDLSSSEENSIIGKTKYTQQFKLPIKEIEKQRLEMSDDEERLQNFLEFYMSVSCTELYTLVNKNYSSQSSIANFPIHSLTLLFEPKYHMSS